MSDQHSPGDTLDTLRRNLRAAHIPFSDADIDGIVAKGFLSRVAAFETMVERAAADAPPDYLGPTGPDDEPRHAPASAAPPLASPAAPALHPTIADTAGLLRARAVSPVELTERALDRIAQRDAALNAFQLVLDERARRAARVAEEEIAAGVYRGPLHGIPVAVKDLLAMAGTVTTAGSKILADNLTHTDAAGVERLEAAGAIIVGKTRMSEFAYSPGSNNAHYGATGNPHAPDRDTGGSSSGSAAAVADGMVFAALGSDTGGSIRIPAALCGVVGLKPTFGRVSLHGATTLSWSLDHLGPLTRSVADAALLLDALAGHDARDPRTRPAPHPDWHDLDAGARGLRVGVLRDDGSGAPLGTPEALATWRAGLAALERAGAELVEVDLPELDGLRLALMVVLATEAASFHGPWLRERLDDYGEFMRQRVLAAYAYGPQSFVRAQQARALLRQRVEAACATVDILCTPSQPDVAPPRGVPASTQFTAPFNALGWPAISVPAALSAAGLPLGVQLAAKPWREGALLRAARALEASL
jgi:aspartyl-tRNA(Asn)/glutamyl-tRNA(Gln) amidotransferase subunit A